MLTMNVWGTERDAGISEPTIEVLDDEWDEVTREVDIGEYVRRLSGSEVAS